MGASTGQIDRTYGHLLPDAVGDERALLDAFGARQEPGAAETQGILPSSCRCNSPAPSELSTEKALFTGPFLYRGAEI
jgi:hypothetical protein